MPRPLGDVIEWTPWDSHVCSADGLFGDGASVGVGKVKEDERAIFHDAAFENEDIV